MLEPKNTTYELQFLTVAKFRAGSQDDLIRYSSTLRNRLLASRAFDTDTVTSVAFSPTGKTLATGSLDKTIRLWDSRTGQLLNTFVGHTSYVSCVAFAPDGNTVASASSDHTVRLWTLPRESEARDK